MRPYPLALTAVLALAIALPSIAAEKPRPTQSNQSQPKKVWTNDDMDQLRSRGLISVVGQEAPAATPQPAVAPAEPTFPIYNSRLEDPEWYAKKAADLQAELDKREAALQEQQNALASAVDRVTQPGIAMDQPSAVTPAESIAMLQGQVQEVQTQLDELSDLARRNNISPGVLRG
jgi:hypothetical protein